MKDLDKTANERPCLSDIALAVGERLGLKFSDLADEENADMIRGRYWHARYGISGTGYNLYVYKYALDPDVIIFCVEPDIDSTEGMATISREICTKGFSYREISLLIDGMWTCYRKLAMGWHIHRNAMKKNNIEGV